VFEAPVFEAPVFEAPVFEAPVFEAPVFESPEVPVADLGIAEAPISEAPIGEWPDLPALHEPIESALIEDAPTGWPTVPELDDEDLFGVASPSVAPVVVPVPEQTVTVAEPVVPVIAEAEPVAPVVVEAEPAREATVTALRGRRSMGAPTIVAQQVSRRFAVGESTVGIDRIDLRIEPGEFVGVTGPTASGKSVLMQCLAGLDRIDSGSVTFDGVDISHLADADRAHQRSAAMGFVLQVSTLVPVFSAQENVELPLLLAGWDPLEARAEAARALELVDMRTQLTSRPEALSGGEQQLVMIARAIAGEPDVVWADEPLAHLDPMTAASTIELLSSLCRRGSTVVMASSDPAVLVRADRIVTLSRGALVPS
jgi:putative ABC transport system ATP-binding protein